MVAAAVVAVAAADIAPYLLLGERHLRSPVRVAVCTSDRCAFEHLRVCACVQVCSCVVVLYSPPHTLSHPLLLSLILNLALSVCCVDALGRCVLCQVAALYWAPRRLRRRCTLATSHHPLPRAIAARCWQGQPSLAPPLGHDCDCNCNISLYNLKQLSSTRPAACRGQCQGCCPAGIRTCD